MIIIRLLLLSLLSSLISFVIIFFAPIEIIINTTEPVYSPYNQQIETLIHQQPLSNSQREELNELVVKEKSWFEKRRYEKKSKNAVPAVSIRTYILEKSTRLFYLFMMIWALLSYLYLHNRPLKYGPILLVFPLLFMVLGYISVIAFSFTLMGVVLSLVAIKFINPLIGKIR